MSDPDARVDASLAEAHFMRALDLMEQGETDAAITALRETLSHAPWLGAAHINLGLLLREREPQAAEQHYRTALALDPHRIEAQLHLGALLAGQKRFEEAEYLYRGALALEPDSPAALSNLGVLLACTERQAQAMACFRAAIALAPDYGNAHVNLAYLLLRAGELEAGWAALEHRAWYARFDDWFDFPRWTGASLMDKSLLIGVEAGHGDMIQFCRYANVAKQAGAARVGLVCHTGLKRLFQTIDGVDIVYGLEEEVPRQGWDYWTPPLSMPYRCHTRLHNIPDRLPYLAADQTIRRQHIAAIEGLRLPRSTVRVGLVWQGNPHFENDADRSMRSMAPLAPLASVENVDFFSLQKGAGEVTAGSGSDSRDSPFRKLVDLAPYLRDFADTAALIAELDLVIAVDTAVAHLAGALGKPCWVMLPAHQPDWRWLADREDSPWYPGVMRLFRQSSPGNWDDVVARVRAALLRFVEDAQACAPPEPD